MGSDQLANATPEYRVSRIRHGWYDLACVLRVHIYTHMCVCVLCFLGYTPHRTALCYMLMLIAHRLSWIHIPIMDILLECK